MARKKESEKKGKETKRLFEHTKQETLQGVFSVIFFVVGIFFVLASFGKAGIVGEKLYYFFKLLFGVGYFLLPLFFFILCLSFILNIKQHFTTGKIISALVGLLSGLGIVDLILKDQGGVGGGTIGHLISFPLLKLFAFPVSLVILFGVLIISLLLTFDVRIDSLILTLWRAIFSRKEKEEMNEEPEEEEEFEEEKEIVIPAELLRDDPPADEEKENEKKIEKDDTKKAAKLKPLKESDQVIEEFIPQPKPLFRRNENYIPLPLSLLELDKGKPGVGDIKANANIIKRTLQNFGINVEMDEVTIGPSVTRYALKPAEGVKLARIVALQNDLSLALAAHPIRIEAPIPGKSLVGIEIPNNTKTTVGLGTLLASPEYQQSEKPLYIALGKAISGKSIFANVAKMPHLLIAGATGSGKSVTIHSLITSLLYRNSPQNLKFIMIDPKRVELTLYNKIPHRLTPVITEAKKAILSLKWAAKEMDRRYDILESVSVRDIDSYHKTVLEPALKKIEGKKDDELEPGTKIPDPMPYIVIVIDELADIMQTYPRELESAIVRLAQMSRAVGIHLMLSTQRPSVNVITGLIKANIPSRIALQVASQIDSRTILDTSGAEKLLGAGDMLYLGGEMSKPLRIQCPYVSENELKKVVKFLTENYEGEMPSDITLSADKEKNSIFEASLDNDSLEDDDELYEEAREIIVEAGKASTSYIQRKLRVGYARAARLMDILEERGVIGPADGSKPRSVIGQEMQEAQDAPPGEI